MDVAKHLQVHTEPGTHCLTDKQCSTLAFPEDRDNPCCCVKQDRNDLLNAQWVKGIFKGCKFGVGAFCPPCPCRVLCACRGCGLCSTSPASCPACLLLFNKTDTLNATTSDPANGSVCFGSVYGSQQCGGCWNSHQMNFQAALAGNNMRSRWASCEAQGNEGWNLFLKGLLVPTPLICARQLPDAGSMLAGIFSYTTLLLMKRVIPS